MIATEPAAVTRDTLFGGRLSLTQPAKGHRAGTDAVLLAAAVPRDFAGLCYDVGAGVGAAGLGVALACPAARVRLIENDPLASRLAEDNIRDNGLGGRVDVLACDVLDAPARRAAVPDRADLVVTNPPFHAPGRVRASPDAGRRTAHVMAEGVTLADWIGACVDLLAPKGTLIIVHAAPALPDLLAALGKRFGATTVLAIHARPAEPAKRVLVRGIEGSRAPFVIAAPLILHDGNRFTETAERLHRGDMPLLF